MPSGEFWYDSFLSKYRAGISHEFLFYFNVRDLVDNYRYMDRYIYEEFIKKRNFGIIAFYDISRGLTFFDAGMEKEFNIITANEASNLMNAMPSRIFPISTRR